MIMKEHSIDGTGLTIDDLIGPPCGRCGETRETTFWQIDTAGRRMLRSICIGCGGWKGFRPFTDWAAAMLADLADRNR